MFFGNNKRANLSFPCFVLMVASLLLLSPYQLRCTLVMPTGKAAGQIHTAPADSLRAALPAVLMGQVT